MVTVMTGVPLVGWLFSTTRFVRVTLPLLLTLPVKTNSSPGPTGLAGQVLTSTKDGVVCAGQEAVAEAVTLLPQMVRALTVRVSSHGPQSFSGTV